MSEVKKTQINKRNNEARQELKGRLEDRLKEEKKNGGKHKGSFYQRLDYDEDGQLKTSSFTAVSKIPNERPFIKLYIDDLVTLKGAPAACKGVLFSLLKHLKYEEYLISINSFDRKKIAEECGFKDVQAVSNAIVSLKKAGILMSVLKTDGKPEQGVFEVNAYLFGRGDWAVNFAKRTPQKLTILYTGNEGKSKVVNEDALVHYINTETDQEKRNKALETLEKIRGIKTVEIKENNLEEVKAEIKDEKEELLKRLKELDQAEVNIEEIMTK